MNLEATNNFLPDDTSATSEKERLTTHSDQINTQSSEERRRLYLEWAVIANDDDHTSIFTRLLGETTTTALLPKERLTTHSDQINTQSSEERRRLYPNGR